MIQLDQAYERAARIPGMRSLLVSREGKLVRQEYFNGAGPDLLYDIKSATKSVTSALIGIAIERGFIRSVEEPISRYLGSILDGCDERIGQTTIADLLTMRAGHAWDVFSDDEFRNWGLALDPLVYILDKPIVEQPGTRFNYSDGAAHLASVVLSEATGATALGFADEVLFRPLGISKRQYWYADRRGYNLGGVGLHLRPSELLAFGELYRNRGKFGGQQLVPAEWVEESTRQHVGVDDGVARHEEEGGIVLGGSYGYFWWRGRWDVHDFYFAKGHGGQYVLNVPTLDLVVVSTCDHITLERGQVWQNELDVIRLIVVGVLPGVPT